MKNTLITIISLKHVYVILLSVLAAVSTESGVFAQDNAERTRRFEVPYCKLDFGKRLIKIPSDEYLTTIQYVTVTRNVQSELYNGLRLRIHAEAVPFDKNDYRSTPNASIRVFAAFTPQQDDLIELSWVFHGQHLRMVSSINAMRLDIDLDEIDNNHILAQFGKTTRDRAKGLIAALFLLEGENTYGEHYQIDLPWPDALEDEVTFCSNPNRSIRTLGRWHQRVDAFVHDGVLSILSYKHIPQMMMYRDGSKWFPDDFRTMIHERAREQGKMPE